MNIFDFFSTLLESVTITHKYHLESDEYSGHMALDGYYEDAPDIIDSIIESYQGKYRVEKQGKNLIPKAGTSIEYLNKLYRCVKDGAKLFDSDEDSEILSSLDDLSNLIDGTLYKLKRLGRKNVKENMKLNMKLNKNNNRMKSLNEYIKESLKNEEISQDYFYEDEESGEIETEDDFREYAENKFKEVFGEELDEDQMNETIDGILEDNPKMVEDGDWGSLVGILNKSFGG